MESEEPILIGKARKFRPGDDLAIIASGRMVHEAIQASNQLARAGIGARVLVVHTIKPLDEEAILKAAAGDERPDYRRRTQYHRRIGSTVAELTSASRPVPVKRMGVNDRFGFPGKEEDLFAYFGLTANHIVEEAKKLLGRESS